MFYEWRWHPAPASLQELEDDLCHVVVGQRMEQPGAWWGGLRNVGGGLGTPRSEWRGCGTSTGNWEGFQGGWAAQFSSQSFQRCIWACLGTRWTAEVLSFLLFLEENPPEVPGSRTNAWQGCAEGHPGAPRAAAQPIRCRLRSVHTKEGLVRPRQGWVKITLSVQPLQSQ